MTSMKRTIGAAVSALLLGSACLAPSALAAGTHAAHASVKPITLTVLTGGDVNIQNLFQDELDPLFEREHPGIKVNTIFAESSSASTAAFARFAASIAAHQPSFFDISGIGMHHHFDIPLNTSNVPNLAKVTPGIVDTLGYGDGMPYRGSSVVIAYNSLDVKQPPHTFAQLVDWIKANPGRFSYCSPSTGGSGDAFVQYVLSQHLSNAVKTQMENVYNTKLESQWTPGFQELKSLGASMYRHGYYPNGNTAILNLLASSTLWMAPVWSDMSMQALAEHQLPPNIKLIQLSPPLYGGPALMGVPKNSAHKVQALEFLNFLLSPQAQTIIVDNLHGYPGIEFKYMPKRIQEEYKSISSSYGTSFNSDMDNDMAKIWQQRVAQ